MKLSLVIPCYNEVKNIPFLMEKLAPFKDINCEVILVDNGSKDETSAILMQELAKPENQFLKTVKIEINIGYGNGIMQGIKRATGDVIAWTHADLQTDVDDVKKAFELFCNHTQKNIFLKGVRRKRKFADTMFTSFMSVISSLVLQAKLWDINAQPKMFYKEFLDLAPNPPNDFSLDLYFYYLARKHDYTLIEVPVDFKLRLYGEAKGGGGSDWKTKYKLIKRTWKYIFQLRKEIQTGIR
jgi:glycosyltransferase involved in cell wall biosynthesis